MGDLFCIIKKKDHEISQLALLQMVIFCGLSTKYESGSGWPSFYESLPDVFETKTDHHIGYARTEYHCKNCGGHHGHIFEDGPNPTGKRYCNNGICLTFKPKNEI